MFCNNCGAQNADGVKFCSNCGKSLVANPQSSDGFTIFKKLFLGGVVVWVLLIIADFFYRKDSYYLNPAFYQPSAMKPIEGVLFSSLICLGAWLVGAIILAFIFRALKKA